MNMRKIPATAWRRVPEITAWFWITKVITTALGEATSDFLVFRISPPVAVGLGALGFLGALGLQLAMRRYLPWVYWLTVTMVAIFGTMAADVLHVGFGVPYAVSTGFFAVVLAVVFTLWYRVEKTLSVHSIYTFRRELFYWTTVVVTFALGTAAGDLAASTAGLGYFSAGLVFAGLIAVPALVYWKLHTGEVAMFWLAYILTRPLGASFADWAGKSKAIGGLGFGDGSVSLVLGVVLVICVGYMSLNRPELKREST